MTLDEYSTCVEQLPYGKRLPTAIYVLRTTECRFGEQLDRILSRLVATLEVGEEFNILKFHRKELKLSLLSYPEFFDDPHPALKEAITVDLVTRKARRMHYRSNLNPPILHRKETLLPADHPDRSKFEKLTKAEEEAGLYEKTDTIGFKLNWEQLLVEKGVSIRGHTVSRASPVAVSQSELQTPIIHRHKTALTRYELSKPVKTLLEYGLLKRDETFFDYGCGQGSDVRGLQALEHQAEGWDPVHRPEVPKQEADIVNMGYVLNVIEDPVERVETLIDAHRHARRLLVVSALINETVDTARAKQYADGVLTRANTFQKFFEQQELQQYIEDALDSTAVPVALGVFYVFRDPADQQDFLSARSRRAIDWTQISARLGLGGPRTLWKALYEEHKELLDAFGKFVLDLGRFPENGEYEQLTEVSETLGSAKRALRAYVQGGGAETLNWDEIRRQFGIGQPPRRRWELLYEEHGELLDSFWTAMLQLGRLPEPEEFSQYAELREKVGSPKQALRIFIQKGGEEEFQHATENRRRDLLVYVALANLRKRVPFGHLSNTLRLDVRAFFGNYTRALEKGIELLYAAGDPDEIELACEDLKLGWQDEQALYIHRSLITELPPILRAYVGCAETLYGDVSQADVIKLHRGSGKVTFLVYDDFDGNQLPELKHRIKVNLRTRWVQVFDHSAEHQLILYKERLLSPDHPDRAMLDKFSQKARALGIPERAGNAFLRSDFERLIEVHGLNKNLNRRRKSVSERA